MRSAARRRRCAIWARSFLLRYEPSGAVGFAYRVRVRERLGATTPQVLTATGYEQLAAVTAGAIAAVAGFVAAGGRSTAAPRSLLAGALAVAAVALRPAWLGDRIARWAARRGIAVAGPLRGRTLAQLVAINVAGWAATAGGAALLAGGLLGAAAPGAFVLLGAFALSCVVGVLLPLLPAGLGPRDAVLARRAHAGASGPAPATVLALALRVVSFAGELLAVAVAELAALVLARRERAPPRRPADAPGHAPPPLCRRAERRAGEPRTIVVVPTYDERESLPLFVERFAPTGLELLIVDDSSPDGTGELADALAAERPWMHVLHRAEKDGLGMAYRAGFGWCLERDYAVIGQMDCDLSHPPEKLAEMRAVLLERDAGLVLGSRYLPGGGTDGWSATRLAMSRIGCSASRLALGLPFSDLSGGFKLWRAGLPGGDRPGRAAQRRLRLPGRDDAARPPRRRAHRGGAVRVLRARRGRVEDDARISLEGIRVTLALRRHHRPRRVP